MRWTDGLIGELEGLNLAGVQSLSPMWGPRLQLLLASLPFDYAASSNAPTSPSEVLDIIYDIQARLLELKRGESRKDVLAQTAEEAQNAVIDGLTCVACREASGGQHWVRRSKPWQAQMRR
jgi:hypothetical protein